MVMRSYESRECKIYTWCRVILHAQNLRATRMYASYSVYYGGSAGEEQGRGRISLNSSG